MMNLKAVVTVELLNLYNGKYYETSLDALTREYPIGWKSIVNKLIEDLYASDWDGKLSQVKEKFGELRFYITNCPEHKEEFHFLIEKAENESRHTCQECGESPATQNDDGWIKTLCQKCQSNKEIF